MQAVDHTQDDILVLHFSDTPIVRETSQDWNIHISYAEDGSVVEIVILDAIASGRIPFQAGPDTPQRKAA